MDRYRGKVKIGGSDLAAEAAPEEEAALDSDLNDQTFRLRHVTVYTALERFILGDQTKRSHVNCEDDHIREPYNSLLIA